MSMQRRALMIGLMGPIIQTVGLIWALLKAAFFSPPELTFRYLIFDPPHLMIAVGVAVSVVAIPVVIDVARAAPKDVEIETFEYIESEAEEPAEGRTEGAVEAPLAYDRGPD
jgi:hypothetical protein